MAYGLELEVIQRLKAKSNQGKRNDLSSGFTDPDDGGKTQKTDLIVGKQVGMSETSYMKAKRVIESGNQKANCYSKIGT